MRRMGIPIAVTTAESCEDGPTTALEAKFRRPETAGPRQATLAERP